MAMRASHLLVKHEGSRRKASWKDPEGAVISTRTRDQAVTVRVLAEQSVAQWIAPLTGADRCVEWQGAALCRLLPLNSPTGGR